MGLRTRKRGYALGIVLMIAVVVACAVWIGQSLERPTSAQDMLRSIPLFPGARGTQYATLEEPSWASWNGETARVVYRVDDPPQSVLDFYSDNLTRGGWETVERGRQRWEFYKIDGFISGFSLKGDAPWIIIEQERLQRRAYVIVYRLENNGEEFSEVMIEFTPAAYSRHRF